MTEEGGRMIVNPKVVYYTVLLFVGGLVLSGCVLSEKYEAEKARSLNFQRLLAQEEKRTSELDSEVKRTKRELSEYEARNKCGRHGVLRSLHGNTIGYQRGS